MRKKKKAYKEGGSLRTFFLYTFLVLAVIIISLSIKAVSIYKNNKFDGNNIAISIIHENSLVGILGFNTIKNSIIYINVKDKIKDTEIAEKLGVITDAKVASLHYSSDKDSLKLLERLLWDSGEIKTDLTIFDKIRLYHFAKSAQANKIKSLEVNSNSNPGEVDNIISQLLADDTVISENTSVQIINTTDIPGLGKKFERIILNKGGNVVAVSTSRKEEKNSKILYVGEANYTVKKIQKLFKFPIEQNNENTIADIIILIGRDYKNHQMFTFTE